MAAAPCFERWPTVCPAPWHSLSPCVNVKAAHMNFPIKEQSACAPGAQEDRCSAEQCGVRQRKRRGEEAGTQGQRAREEFTHRGKTEGTTGVHTRQWRVAGAQDRWQAQHGQQRHLTHAASAPRHAPLHRAAAGATQRGLQLAAPAQPQRTIAEAQDSPAPKPAMASTSPGWMSPRRTASSRAMGMEAAEVLPYWLKLLTTRSAGAKAGLLGTGRNCLARGEASPGQPPCQPA